MYSGSEKYHIGLRQLNYREATIADDSTFLPYFPLYGKYVLLYMVRESVINIFFLQSEH